MRRALTFDDVEPAVVGGTILGGGGGGHIDDGLRLGQMATSMGSPQLWTIDEIPSDGIVVVCAGVGAPGAPDQFLQPVHYLRALEQLQTALTDGPRGPVVALATNENGAMGSVNGWLQAVCSGLPVLDAPCNGRAHPTGLMGSLGLHRDADYVACAGYAGGSHRNYVEGCVTGRLDRVSQIVRDASVTAGGLVAVARNPVPAHRLSCDGAVGGISQALEVGRAHLERGVRGVVDLLDGEIVIAGPVSDLRIEQRGGFDVGRFRIDDVVITFVNEYLSAHRGDDPVGRFPDLIMTFTTEGLPVVSADLQEGLAVTVITAPASSLRLSSTMAMPELMEPVAELLKQPAQVLA